MSNPVQPISVAHDLVRIHKVITRALHTSAEKTAEFARLGFQSAAVQQGFADYIRSLAVILTAHHLAEDEVLFPILKEKLPQGPYEKLTEVHEQIAELVMPINRSADVVAAGGNGEALQELQEVLSQVLDLWHPHIRMEESIFSDEALSEVMTQEEQASLGAGMGQHSSQHIAPMELSMPFVLFNMEPEDRMVYLAHLPPAMMDEMVMKAWRPRWEPMKPFLLD